VPVRQRPEVEALLWRVNEWNEIYDYLSGRLWQRWAGYVAPQRRLLPCRRRWHMVTPRFHDESLTLEHCPSLFQ